MADGTKTEVPRAHFIGVKEHYVSMGTLAQECGVRLEIAAE